MKRSSKSTIRWAKAEDKAVAKEVSKAKVQDSFQNFAAMLGLGTQNIISGSGYGYNPITRVRTRLEWMHRGSWLAGAVVDLVADDMTRAGATIKGQIKPDNMEAIQNLAVQLKVWNKISSTIKWGRLYGGALGVLLIQGQDFSKPYRPEVPIGKGDFRGILPLDRWMLGPTFEDMVTELGPEMGLPKYYKVNAAAPALQGEKIHHSRVFRMLGVELPYQQQLTEDFWSISVIERLYDRMVNYDSSTAGAAQLVYKAYIRTYKIENLRAVIAAGGPALAGVMKFVEFMRMFQSNEGITLLDDKDTFETHNSPPFAGVSDVIDQMGQQLAGATGIPLVRLFGMSPRGFNSTGESDMRLYYDTIHQRQVVDLLVPLTNVYRLMAQSLGIKTDDSFGLKFNPLWQLTEEQKATIAASHTDSVSKAVENGLATQETGMKELRQQSEVTGLWTNITDEDIAAAETDLPPIAEKVEVAEIKEGELEPGVEDSSEELDSITSVGGLVAYLKRMRGDSVQDSLEYEQAKIQQAALYAEELESNRALKAFKTGPMGLTPEAIKNDPSYIAAKSRNTKAFAELQRFNSWFVKKFAPEEKQRRRQRDSRYRVRDNTPNARKIHEYHGLQVVIENPQSTRRQGTAWQTYMPADYGYISGVTGADGAQLDCYVGPSPESNKVFVIDQRNLKTGDFDEHKVMLGYWSKESAVEDYVLGYTDGTGPQRIMSCTPMDMVEFKDWIVSGNVSGSIKA